MRRETQNVVLVLVGGALLKIALTGTYLRYVKPGLLPWLVGAGVVIVGLAAVSIALDIRRGGPPGTTEPAPSAARSSRAVQRFRAARSSVAPASLAAQRNQGDANAAAAGKRVPDRDDEPISGGPIGTAPDTGGAEPGHSGGRDGDSHAGEGGHDHGPSRSPWLLLLPVLAIFLVAPPALGADSVTRAGGRSLADQQRSAPTLAPLPPGPDPLLRLSDFATRVVWDRHGTLNGRTIRLSGFVVRDRRDGQPVLARLVITCCAADAMPVKARLARAAATAPELAALRTDEWVEVTGEAVPNSGGAADGYVPAFRVTAVHEIPAPADPYEY